MATFNKVMMALLVTFLVIGVLSFTGGMAMNQAVSKIDVEKSLEARSKAVKEAATKVVATFDDLRAYDGYPVIEWHNAESVVKIGDNYLHFEPDVYSALRYVVTSSERLGEVDSVRVYERVLKIRELRERFQGR